MPGTCVWSAGKGWPPEEACCARPRPTPVQSARKRPTMAQLLLHPWIQLHARRPSIPPPSPAASDLHLRLQELAGHRAPPFSELHRHSLHGAKSVRDFSSLLSPAPSGSPHLLTAMLQPALSMAGPSLTAAAAAAQDSPASVWGSGSSNNSTMRPTTASSRLGPGAGHRPVTPLAGPALQTLSSCLPAPAFPQAESSVTVGDERSAVSDTSAAQVPSSEHAATSWTVAAAPSSRGRGESDLGKPACWCLASSQPGFCACSVSRPLHVIFPPTCRPPRRSTPQPVLAAGAQRGQQAAQLILQCAAGSARAGGPGSGRAAGRLFGEGRRDGQQLRVVRHLPAPMCQLCCRADATDLFLPFFASPRP